MRISRILGRVLTPLYLSRRNLTVDFAVERIFFAMLMRPRRRRRAGKKEDCPTLSQRPFQFDEVGELSVSLRQTLNDDAGGDILC